MAAVGVAVSVTGAAGRAAVLEVKGLPTGAGVLTSFVDGTVLLSGVLVAAARPVLERPPPLNFNSGFFFFSTFYKPN
jgi:hypothetical protein